jgi:predicted RNase H-like nuclease (RuvC/YqgF family)
MDATIAVGLLVLVGSIITSIVTLWKSRKETLAMSNAQREESRNTLLQITNAAAVQNAQSWMQAMDRISALEKEQTTLEAKIKALEGEIDRLKKENTKLREDAAEDHETLAGKIKHLEAEVARLLAENQSLQEQISEERRLRTEAEASVKLLSARVKELEQLNHGI